MPNSSRMIFGANTRWPSSSRRNPIAPRLIPRSRIFSSKYASNGAYQIAVIHALRKEPDEMFRWLDNAYATHDSGLTQLVITPFVFEYRDDPRFVALCQKLGVQLPASRER